MTTQSTNCHSVIGPWIFDLQLCGSFMEHINAVGRETQSIHIFPRFFALIGIKNRRKTANYLS